MPKFVGTAPAATAAGGGSAAAGTVVGVGMGTVYFFVPMRSGFWGKPFRFNRLRMGIGIPIAPHGNFGGEVCGVDFCFCFCVGSGFGNERGGEELGLAGDLDGAEQGEGGSGGGMNEVGDVADDVLVVPLAQAHEEFHGLHLAGLEFAGA